VASYSYGKLTIPVTADTRSLASDIRRDATSAGQQAASGISGSMNSGLRAASGILGGVAKAATTAIGGASIAATGFGISAFKTAARVGEMDASLRALAKANNLSYDAMQQSVSAVRKQGIEAGVAQTLVAQFARNQLDLSKSTDLARVAQDAAVISGRNSTEVLDDLVHGITTQNSMVLRNAGLNVQAGQAMSAYAKSVGKTTAELTDAERSQAVLNAVLESGKTVAGAYAEAMTEPGKVLRSFPRIVDDIKLSVGQGLVQALGPAIIGAYDLAKALSAAVAPGGALAPIFAAIGEAVAKLMVPVNNMITSWAKWIEGLKPEQIERITDSIKRFGPAALAAAGAMGVLTGGSILGKIPILGSAISGLTGPIGTATSGIVKLGGSALAAVPGLGSMGSAAGLLPAAMNPVGAAVVGIVAAIGLMFAASKDFRTGVLAMGSALWDGLKPALSSVWTLLKTFGSALWEIVKAVGDALGPALKNLAPLLSQIGQLFGQNMAGGADGASSSLGAIVPVITGVIRVIGFLLDITTRVLVPIIEIPLKLAVLASKALAVVHPLKLMGQAIEWLTGVVQKLWHWITGNSPGLIPAFGLLGQVAGQVAGAMAGVVAEKFGQMVSAVSSATKQIGSVAAAGWRGLESGARTAGSSMVEGLKAGLGAAKSLGGWIGSNVTGPVVGFLKSGLGVSSPSTITIHIGADVIAGLQQGLAKAKELGGWVMGNVVNPIIGTLKSAFKIGSPSKVTKGLGEDVAEGWAIGLAALGEAFTLPSPLAGNGLGNLGGLGAGGQGSTINVYPSAGMDERDLAAAVSRELAWAAAGGVA
jgi:hypothetical protein